MGLSAPFILIVAATTVVTAVVGLATEVRQRTRDHAESSGSDGCDISASSSEVLVVV